MKIRYCAIAASAVLLSACEVTLSVPTPVDSTPAFVTATLRVTPAPQTTPTATATTTPPTSLTVPANCRDALRQVLSPLPRPPSRDLTRSVRR